MIKLVLRSIGRALVIIYGLIFLLINAIMSKVLIAGVRPTPDGLEAATQGLKAGIIMVIVWGIFLYTANWAWKKTKAPPPVPSELPVELKPPPVIPKLPGELIEKVKANDIEGCKKLLNENCNINEQDNKGATALIYAVLETNEEIIKLLLEHGANKKIKTAKGVTAIGIAKNNNLTYILQILNTR